MIEMQPTGHAPSSSAPVAVGPLASGVLGILAFVQAALFALATVAGLSGQWEWAVASVIGIGFTGLSVLAGIGWLRSQQSFRWLVPPLMIAAAGLTGDGSSGPANWGVWVAVAELIALIVYLAVNPSAIMELKPDSTRAGMVPVRLALGATALGFVTVFGVGYSVFDRDIVRFDVIPFAHPLVLVLLFALAGLGVMARRGSGGIMLTVAAGAALVMDGVILLTWTVLSGELGSAVDWFLPSLGGGAMVGTAMMLWRNESDRVVHVGSPLKPHATARPSTGPALSRVTSELRLPGHGLAQPSSTGCSGWFRPSCSSPAC